MSSKGTFLLIIRETEVWHSANEHLVVIAG